MGKFYQSLAEWHQPASGLSWLRNRPFLVILVLALICWLIVAAVLVGVLPSGT